MSIALNINARRVDLYGSGKEQLDRAHGPIRPSIRFNGFESEIDVPLTYLLA
jgi:hypothetical protein